MCSALLCVLDQDLDRAEEILARSVRDDAGAERRVLRGRERDIIDADSSSFELQPCRIVPTAGGNRDTPVRLALQTHQRVGSAGDFTTRLGTRTDSVV